MCVVMVQYCILSALMDAMSELLSVQRALEQLEDCVGRGGLKQLFETKHTLAVGIRLNF